jgi:hypothetical protein
VREVKLQDPPVSPGIQYWRCEVCGFVWGDARWARAVEATISLSPSGGVMLERLVMLASLVLIAYGIITGLF